MRPIALIYLSLTFALVSLNTVAASPNPSYVCSFCVIALGLLEQSAYQIKLENYLLSKCPSQSSPSICEFAVKAFIKSLEAKTPPDAICKSLDVCPDQCTLYTEWPVKLHPQPIPWDVERRLEKQFDNSVVKDLLLEFASVMPSTRSDENHIPMIAHVVSAIANLVNSIKAFDVDVPVEYEPCGFNFTCHAMSVADHKPFQDHDGDRFSIPSVKKLRGSDWRGTDCSDVHSNIYPGRLVNDFESNDNIDHNCNGIYGSNSTGSYEDILCSDVERRGLIMLGDSATAHFHIPPQWVTAQGWNLDGLLSVAANELDFPMCSWGTGHVSIHECPYQTPIPGVEGIVSLYTQLRERNRCNNNDFQNVGVNGARMTSSKGLIDAFARDAKLDAPVLLWLSLIGNDVCNGHPNFDSMTTPDEFYRSAMESLNRLDTMLPSGSYVVSLALFDGELLYDTMHNQQHPVGASYRDFYEFMNCLEENPCWGWLNANQTVRQITTAHSDALNNVYRNISRTASFNNFKYIFYSPSWADMFKDYAKTGLPLTNLIEPSDGFHPSQAGNALFAKTFFSWFEENHPDALGAVNPNNAEIDSIFFKS